MKWPGRDDFTREDARMHRYGAWAGNPKGRAYDAAKCAAEVQQNWHSFQCQRKAGFGPEELYCKQHAKKAMVA